MQKTRKIIRIATIILCVSMTLSVLLPKYENANNEDLQNLAVLNTKYGLIEVLTLDEKSTNKSLEFFPDAETLKTDIINSTNPEKELILKVEKSAKNKDLRNIIVLRLKTNEDIEKIAKEYENISVVKYAEPNYKIEIKEIETIADKPEQILENENSENYDKDEKVLVAVIDSGVDVTHTYFEGKIVEGRNFIDDSTDVADELGHGTHVAGIIVKNAPSAEIMPLKFTDGKNGKLTELVKAIKYAVDNGAKIINLSLGIQEKSDVLEEAINYANENGAIIVAAAGNYNSDEEYYPAAFESVIAVSGLKNNGEKLANSNFGEWIDFSTEAEDVYSASPDGRYSFRTGTSQAAPVITSKIANIYMELEQFSYKNIYRELEEISESILGEYAGLLGNYID